MTPGLPGSSYDSLYRQWEESNWSATAIDFSIDAQHWESRLSEVQRRSAVWNYSMFLTGVETVARAVRVLTDSAPSHEAGAFLATQVADQARQHVFLDRFTREVARQGSDTQSTRRAVQDRISWGFRQILDDLDRTAESLRRKPKDLGLVTQVTVLTHLIIEGVLAVPGQYFIQRYVEAHQIMPGLSAGIEHIVKDEVRHVTFGIMFLGDLVRGSSDCRAAAVHALDRAVPWTVGVFIPPDLDESYVTCFDATMNEVYAYGLKALESRVATIGIDPNDLYLLSRENRELGYEDRAARLLTLISDGVLGDHRKQPKLSQDSLEILFEATARSIDLEIARSVGGPIEWSFTDAEPWHLIVVDDHAEAKPGGAGDPALRLEISSGDWAKIAVGRADPRRALLTRKLRVHGAWNAKAKLPKLFN